MIQATPAAPSARRARRRWFRYSLRSLLALLTIACVFLGVWVHRAERQRRALAAIRDMGGAVFYDYEERGPTEDLPGPDWLCRRIGVDYFDDVWFVYWPRATDVGLAHVGQLTSLRRASFFGTQLTSAGLPRLIGLKNLVWLDLEQSRVTDAGLVHLESLTNLNGLVLAETPVTGAGLAHLGGLKNLTELSLDGTQVTDEAVTHLRTLPHLERLVLINYQAMKPRMPQVLRSTMPNCAILIRKNEDVTSTER